MTKINHTNIIKNGHYNDLTIKGVEPELVKNLYDFMLRLRMCEEALLQEYHPADQIRCPVHFCIGQEAVPAACSLLLNWNDFFFSHHRSHGYFLAKKGSMRNLFAELYGRKTGANGGISGSQEISLPSVNFHSGAILTGMLGIAVGTALGLQLKNKPNIAVAGFGDGAADEGLFWEAINYAALRKLSVVFICENNKYSTYSHQLKRQAADNISQRVASFGVKTQTLFGNDVIAVHNALSEAITHARDGKGPFFIEAYTYRWNGHVGPEDDDYLGYRPESELDFWKDNCPISLLEEKMLTNGVLTMELKQKLVNDIKLEITDAFEFAQNSAFPDKKNWEELNYSIDAPMLNKLSNIEISEEFNQDQADTIPGPY